MAARSDQADRQGRPSVQHATRAADSAAHQTASDVIPPSTQAVQAAVLSPQQASPAQLHEIQRLYGNRAVQRLLTASAPATLQWRQSVTGRQARSPERTRCRG